MHSLSLKMPLMLIALFFLGLASRDLNIHHQRLSLNQASNPLKVAAISPAELAASRPPLKIKQAD
jgi:hypothetical protein